MTDKEEIFSENNAYYNGEDISYLQCNFLAEFLSGMRKGFEDQAEDHTVTGRLDLAVLDGQMIEKIKEMSEITEIKCRAPKSQILDNNRI